MAGSAHFFAVLAVTWPLPAPERALLLLALAPLLFLLTVSLGRWLKRHAGVHLGVTYQLFCIVLSLYAPLHFLGLSAPFDLQRHLGAAAALLGTIFALALIHRYLWELYFHEKRGVEIPKFLRDVFALIIFLAAFATVLSMIYGTGITGVLLPSTVIVGIVGWAMQDLLGNIISGVSLQLGRPFRQGDWLLVDNTYGEVIEVNWRSTRLRTNDDIYLDVPNNQIVRNTITNLTYPTRMHAMRFRIGLEYSEPPNRVKEVLVHAALTAKGVMSAPPPKAFLVDFGDSAVIYEIKYYLEDHKRFNDTNDAIHTNIWYALNRAGFRIPFPMRIVHLDRTARQARKTELSAPVRALLRGRPFFRCLSDAQTDALLDGANLCGFGCDEKIIEQGAEGNSMFILAQGTAGVHVRRNGESAHVATLRAGDYFGEMSLLTGEKRSATIIASCDCEVLEIEKSIFAGVLQENPALLQTLSEMLAQRRLENEGALASTTEKVAMLSKKQEYAASFLAKLYSFFEL